MRKLNLNRLILIVLLILLGIGIFQIAFFLLFDKNLFEFLFFISYATKGISYLRRIAGLVFWVLFPMLIFTIFLLTITALEVLKITKIDSSRRNHIISAAYYMEILAPILGFLQTLTSMFKLLPEIQADLEQAKLLSLFVRRAGEAFGSSIFGLCVMVLAFTLGFIHKIKREGEEHEESSHIPGCHSSSTADIYRNFLPDLSEHVKRRKW